MKVKMQGMQKKEREKKYLLVFLPFFGVEFSFKKKKV